MRSELYLNDTRVDLTEDISAAITYQVADIRYPQNRNGSYSKTVKLPGTKTLNILLSHIFEIGYVTATSGVVNFTPDFNPNLKCKAVLLVDGLEQFRGYMKLNNIVRDQADLNHIFYEVTLFGESANIFGALGETQLRELTWTDLNHTYNKTNQKATWTALTYGTGYVYPMIDYGVTTPTTWDVNNFFPATYVREILSRIFTQAGYSWNSTFLDSAYFKRLIIPFSGDKLTITEAQAQARLFSATTSVQTSGTCTAGGATYSLNPVVYGTESTDPSNQYDTGTGIFTAANSGYYDFYTSGTVTFDAVTSVTVTNPQYQLIGWHYRGATLIGNYPITGGINYQSSLSYTSGQTIFSGSYSAWSQQIQMIAGDTFQIQLFAGTAIGSGSGTVGVVHSTGAKFMNRIINTAILDGSTLDYSVVMPSDVRCADFLSDILKLYNLYVEPDRTNPTVLNIQTYDDFYGSGTTLDWSHKLDVSKPVIIQPMGALNARRYRFKWSDDGDFWNKFYLDKWGETFGEKNKYISNDFLKNTETLEVMFAGTPCIGSSSHDRIIPEIYNVSSSGVKQPIKSKMRILYWNGALATVTGWTYTSAVSGSTSETTYPYCGHVDNPISPTYDVNLGVPREIYYVNPYGTTSYTDDNIYNHYHKKYYDETTDPNSKVLTAYFRIRPIDIYNLSFTDIIFIDGHNWRLNKISDYMTVTEAVTKCELIKVKDGIPYTRTTADLYWIQEATIGVDHQPGNGGNISVGDTSNVSSNVTVGQDHYVSDTSTGVVISGYRNSVGSNCEYVSVLSSSGVCVASNLHNVTAINCSDLLITDSDVTYINNNKVLTSGEVYNVTTSQTILGAGVYNCTGTLTLTMSTSVLASNDVIQIFNMGTGTLTIAGGGITILSSPATSSATLVTATQYDSITLRYNGTNYIVQ